MIRYWTVTHTAIAKPNGWFFKGTGGFRDNWIRVFHRVAVIINIGLGFSKEWTRLFFIGASGVSAGCILYGLWLHV